VGQTIVFCGLFGMGRRPAKFDEKVALVGQTIAFRGQSFSTLSFPGFFRPWLTVVVLASKTGDKRRSPVPPLI
jgi:hypothetical protein